MKDSKKQPSLRSVRRLMASNISDEDLFQSVVMEVTRIFDVDVCSLYVLRAGNVLELFATQGLKKKAIHQTRLHVGEGLVGHVASQWRPLILEDAQSHPGFAFRPETGEESLHSFAGVPLLRGGRLLGVLVIQTPKVQKFVPLMVEMLETIAMLLSETLVARNSHLIREIEPADGIALRPLRLSGVSLSRGLSTGICVLHHAQIQVETFLATNVKKEQKRLKKAFSRMHHDLDNVLARYQKDKGEHVDVLAAYRLIARDKGWRKKIQTAIVTGLTAEASVLKVLSETRARMNAVLDPYLRERLQDLEDLAFRLIRELGGTDKNNLIFDEDSIVVARSLGPADLLEMVGQPIKGIILEGGSLNSHVAIVARSLQIPMLGQVVDITTRVENGDKILVNGYEGICIVRPNQDVTQRFHEAVDLVQLRTDRYWQNRNLPGVTKDGHGVTLRLNAGLLLDMEAIKSTGAHGVGLYRTEVPFMVRNTLPTVGEQEDLYRQILEKSEGYPVYFRTLDIGGDKVLPYFRSEDEENPAMGWRALRISLDRPSMMRMQLRAMIRATQGGPLRILFPMVTTIQEFLKAKELIELEMKRAKEDERTQPSLLLVGVMLEVPALAFQLKSLLPHVDFVSIGTNDLLQFLFASDRGSVKLARYLDPLLPSSLLFLKGLLETCQKADVPVSICGEMAGNPIEALALVGLGFKQLSMTARSIGPVRQMIRSVHQKKLANYLDCQLKIATTSLRSGLGDYARDHGISLDI